MKQPSKEQVATGALVLVLLGYVYDLVQRVTALETAQVFLHGKFEIPKESKQ